MPLAADQKAKNKSMEEEKLTGLFLHGTLEATIFDGTTSTPSSPFSCIFHGEKPTYVTIKLGSTKVAETSHECDRRWNQTFKILCAHPADTTISITLRTRRSLLGRIRLPAHKLLPKKKPYCDDDCSSFPLVTKKGKPNPKLKLRFRLRFIHAASEPQWGIGLGNGEFTGLSDGVTFRQRSNCSVTLYQDAHHGRSFRPPIRLGGEQRMLRRPRRLWEDVYRAIDGAEHLIYIAGWSFNPNLVLVRDPQTEIPHARGVKLGELLKRKSEEGVAVRIMLWDDETSLRFIRNQGVMRTHDEDAFNYFNHTKVVCRLCPRLHHKFPTLFAHHQKTITVDALIDGGEITTATADGEINVREIISFVGGLDLYDGRYDTEEHSLFRTLNTESHALDFYQINFAGASLHRGGPREPWHDAHACVAGAAAYDVLANFEQRWSKQCDPSFLISLEAVPGLRLSPATSSHSNNNWNVQVFRSIDELSTRHLPENVSIERSIHEAYVRAIRRAERFVYIENQYFMGGCHLWDNDQHSWCENLIPAEIALKVTSKIRAGERFAVYVVIPMWAEGVPDSEPVQDILHWTRLTMAAMYRLVGEAIAESGAVDAHPTDYLNFFCLANREEKGRNEFVPPCSPRHRSLYWNAQKNRRFMIYVHSKLMIVDDEYLLMGSANVNQRSMDGKRDTEIAIGCYQPEFVGARSRSGEVHAYRMSLWYEHTGHLEEAFVEPQELCCVRRLRAIGEAAWKVYSGEAVVDMEGVHLVNYPISVSEDGSVMDDVQGGGGFFPDTNTVIRGKRSKFLPPMCTT